MYSPPIVTRLFFVCDLAQARCRPPCSAMATSQPSSLFTDSKKIIVAAKAGDIDSVMALCGRMPSRSPLLNTRTTLKGETPLIKAVQYGHREVARWLMIVGADPYVSDSGGKSAIQVCIPFHPPITRPHLVRSGQSKGAIMT